MENHLPLRDASAPVWQVDPGHSCFIRSNKLEMLKVQFPNEAERHPLTPDHF